ncbi:MAG: 50S ribosomal protein L10 [Patescibacteria group bacterium]
MNKQNKKDLVVGLTPRLRDAKSIVFVNFAGLSVSLQQKLKLELKIIGSDITVVKNTLIKRAGKEAGINDAVLTDEVLSGQTALILTEGDAVAPIQVLGKFVKENQVPQFKVGIVEGNFQDKDSLIRISTLPTKDVLYSQVIGSLMSPIYGLIGTLNGNMQKLVYILKEVSIRG